METILNILIVNELYNSRNRFHFESLYGTADWQVLKDGSGGIFEFLIS
jgi:hypothetical protein